MSPSYFWAIGCMLWPDPAFLPILWSCFLFFMMCVSSLVIYANKFEGMHINECKNDEECYDYDQEFSGFSMLQWRGSISNGACRGIGLRELRGFISQIGISCSVEFGWGWLAVVLHHSWLWAVISYQLIILFEWRTKWHRTGYLFSQAIDLANNAFSREKDKENRGRFWFGPL